MSKTTVSRFFTSFFMVFIAGLVCFLSGCDEKSPKSVWESASEEMIKGQREAANDSKELLEIKPDVRVMEHEPFFSSVWNGKHVPMPGTMQEVSTSIESGACDYVVVDNLSVRRRSKKLKPLLTGARPLPGTGLVYRRYFKGLKKIFSVYKRGAAPLEVKSGLTSGAAPAELENALKKARRFYLKGHMEHARKLLLDIIEVDPQNALAHRELVKVYIVYGNFDGESLSKAEDHLLRYSFLAPGKEIKSYQETIQRIRTQHKAKWGLE